MANQLQKKFIGDNQVDGVKILIEDGQALRAMDGATEVDLVSIASSEVFLNGVKILNNSSLIPSTVLPSYVDDVVEAADFASLPVTGETGKIYITLDTNKQYRWSGSVYVQITSGAVDSVNGETGIVIISAGDIKMDSEPTVSVESRLVSLKSELDDTQVGAGLETDGSYVAPSAGGAEQTLLGSATSLKDADGILAERIWDVTTATGVFIDLITGAASYVPNASTNYLGSADDLVAADEALDAKIKEHKDKHDGLVTATGMVENPFTFIPEYNPNASTNYLGSATSLKDADEILDSVLLEVANGYASVATAAGLNNIAAGPNWEYVADAGSDYIDTATSLFEADQLLDDQVKLNADAIAALQAKAWYSEKFVVDAQILSDGFVTLANVPDDGSVVAFVDRLAIFEGASEDFEMLVDVMTFVNQLVSPGNQALQIGDEIRVKYMYSPSV